MHYKNIQLSKYYKWWLNIYMASKNTILALIEIRIMNLEHELTICDEAETSRLMQSLSIQREAYDFNVWLAEVFRIGK